MIGSKVDAFVEAAFQQILSGLVVSQALLHAAEARKSASECALAHQSDAISVTGCQFSLALLAQAELLAIDRSEEDGDEEEEEGFGDHEI